MLIHPKTCRDRHLMSYRLRFVPTEARGLTEVMSNFEPVGQRLIGQTRLHQIKTTQTSALKYAKVPTRSTRLSMTICPNTTTWPDEPVSCQSRTCWERRSTRQRAMRTRPRPPQQTQGHRDQTRIRSFLTSRNFNLKYPVFFISIYFNGD